LKIIVVIPTYNEKNNIERMIETVLNVDDRIELLVVDDNSPDGTADAVAGMQQANSRIHLLKRAGKLGLGTAYVDGFKKALELNPDYIVQMDADFSHNPDYIREFIIKKDEADVIIGSRYVKGISVINWPLSRVLLSYFANKYAKIVTRLPIEDCTGGFKWIRADFLRTVNLDKIASNGYAFQIEMNYAFHQKGGRILELPIIFADREEGLSKMSKKVIFEAVTRIWTFRFKNY
jgi:dolichol-phosphate mannosyltransferase